MRPDMLLLILAMAAVTFSTRFGSQVFFQRIGLPHRLDRWLKHVPTGILTALIVPSILMPDGRIDLTLHNNYLIAGIFTAAIAFRFRNTALTMILGLAAVIGLRWLGN